MKKLFTLLTMLVVGIGSSWAENYPINFDKNQTFTRGDRHINSVTFDIGGDNPVIDGLYVNQSTKCYQDLTETKTVSLPKNTSVKPRLYASGVWQHGFVYIDLNKDGDFTDEGELVSKINENNPNLSTDMPSFTTPSEPGEYRMRIKTDWASEDPGGNTGDAPHEITSNNHIIKNGGMIVDVKLIITEYTVTYVVQDENESQLFASSPVATSLGAKITTLPAAYKKEDFYEYDQVDITVSSVNTTATFTATKKTNPLVKFSSDASSAYYYNLKIRGKYMVYNSGATGEVTLQDNSEAFNSNAAWAFIGNPYGGFKMINQANGTDKYLTYTSVVPGSNHGNNNIGFVADDNFTDQYWYVEANTGGICLRMKENTNIYFHHDNSQNFLRTCSVTEYSSVHNDEGSTIVATTDEDVLFALFNNMKAWSFGTSIGQMNTTDASVITNEVATSTMSSIEATILAEQTAAYPSCYNYLMTIKDHMSLVKPTAGFYRLKNVATGKYLTAVSGPQTYSSTTKGVYASNSDGNSAASIIRLNAGNDGLYMYNQGNGFGWVVAGGSVGAGVGYLTSNPDKYVNWFPGKAANQIAFAICYGNGIGNWASYLEKGIYMVDTSDEAVIGGTDYKADAAQWIIEEATSVTISMNSDGATTPTYYATFCAPFSYTVSEGTKAYTLELEQSGGWLVPTEIEGEVTAGTPVLLKGSSATATLTIGSGYVGSPLTDTALTGTYLPKAITGSTDYVLGKYEGKVGFYHWSSSNLAANRAYLAGSSNARGFALMFDDDATGIVAPIGETEEGTTIYNLSGQRLNKMQKGINIVNGKKVLF